MVKFEDIWREQCDAALTIRDRFGETAALDYLVGEKLMRFTSIARTNPEFARQLPSFIARTRKMFARDVMLRYLANLEARLSEKSHEVDPEDMTLAYGAIDDLQSLKQVEDLLRANALGTA